MDTPSDEGTGIFSQYYTPPAPRTFEQNIPTLLVIYWCTGCCVVIILLRLCGRYIRVSTLYRDDVWMFTTIVPLIAYQAFAHVVLKYGTNNVSGIGAMDQIELKRRRIGSILVLGARVSYAAYIFAQKFCITAFYARLTVHFWERRYAIGLKILRYFLLLTFIGYILSIFIACPSKKLWQVTPDPGPECRVNFTSLLTSATIRLIFTVFSLPVFSIAFTGYRVPTVILQHGSQQFRSLLEAVDILVSTIVANAIIINGFARGKGVKKRKPSGDRGADLGENGGIRRAYWGSDDDLVRSVGGGRVPGIAPVQKGYGYAREEGEEFQGYFATETVPIFRPTTGNRMWRADTEGNTLERIETPPSPRQVVMEPAHLRT
ncbi:hypothetical protein BZA77DRAFT_351531 [Pyronema omphalodes]|nr:hypothetical protein BZA77DRAFT_351531 [Pyronema omphalodes]